MTTPSEPTGSPEAIDVIHHLIRTTHYLQREFQAQLAALELPFQISGPRLRVLSTVSDAGRIRMSELAAKLGIKARTVTDFVDGLEKENLLVRCPDPQDRRATLVELTDLARSHLAEILTFQASIAENMLQNISAEERTQLLNAIVKLAADKDLSAICFAEGND
ncbi:MarR family winged helix-turn-helix transcriptional regulator [Paenibacillus sp. GCM10027626]|uniref:MarR family winged helix-turn-helix transcriptional regulator n=1 Tax=Paenibacillus sp. GCM10027626 TaxID=3273411 RepID=UPI003635D8BC